MRSPAGLKGHAAKIKDLNVRELVVVVPLIGLSLFLGIYPSQCSTASSRPRTTRSRTSSARPTTAAPSTRRNDSNAKRSSRPKRRGSEEGSVRREAGGREVIGATQPITRPPSTCWGIAPIMALVGAGVGVVLLRALLRRHAATTPACFALVDDRRLHSRRPACSGSGIWCATTAH